MVKKSSASRVIHSYNIGSTNESDQSDDDEGRSRAIPSRTLIGVKASFGEKHPWALEPLRLFFGLISIPEYIYRYKLSIAKIELMMIDLPRVEYGSHKGTDRVKNVAVDINDKAHRLQEEANRKRAERISFKKMNLSDVE